MYLRTRGNAIWMQKKKKTVNYKQYLRIQLGNNIDRVLEMNAVRTNKLKKKNVYFYIRHISNEVFDLNIVSLHFSPF